MPKPTLPQGTRDFNAEIIRKRNYIFRVIREVFEIYGFEPLETPAMENLDTLMGKYGDEGDKLIFKILNNGLNDPKNIEQAKIAFDHILRGKNDKNLTERALRYDLTIPFARYVAMNYNQLTFPYKRYQVQPVWRADRPQKGRYREFYQCDADVVGSYSLLNEIEFSFIYAEVFEKLGMDVSIKINNRKILVALAEICGGADKMTDISTAIDKLDKIGLEKVKEELNRKGLDEKQTALIANYLQITGSNEDRLQQLGELIGTNSNGRQGMLEISQVLDAQPLDRKHKVQADFTLARGLNYYTGIIFEVKANNVQMGSIGGGGRYDDLTGLFGVPSVPGVGISFGVDRIYDVMEELGLFPAEIHSGTEVLFLNLGETESNTAFTFMQQLREKKIRCELYHEAAKLDKQFKYAEKKGVTYTIKIDSTALAENACIVKNIKTGEQHAVKPDELTGFFSNHIALHDGN